MIKAVSVKRTLGGESILKGISFELEAGGFLAVMGPSGSGKSTLLYSVSGMDAIDGGEVYIDGEPIAKLNDKQLAALRLEKLGFVFQNSQLLKNLSIFDNIALPGLAAAKKTPKEVRARAKMLMNMLGIGQLANRDVREVSGGQLQRACVCRAMINEPRVLFMDEPTGALNSEATEQLLAALEKLNAEGTTIMLVTHDPKVAARAKRALYIRDGEAVGEKELKTGENSEEALERWLKTLRRETV